MANIIATNADTNIDLADTDRLYVPQGVTVIASNNDQAVESDPFNVNANNHEVAVDGAVIAFSATAIALRSDTNGVGANLLVVGSTALVRTLSDVNSALYILGENSQVQNWGEITGRWSAWYEGFDNGVVENHGVMSGSHGDEGIFFTSTDNYTLVNTGLINGGGGVQNASSVGKIWNSGEIIATNPSFQALDLDSSTGDLFVNNSGLISSIGTAIHLDTTNDTLINSGQVIGTVKMFAGNDYFDGRGGFVEGDVEGGTGDDTYLIDDAAHVLVELSGQGLDTVATEVTYALPEHFEQLSLIGNGDINGFGNDLDNLITPNIGANLIDGGDGIDTVSYGGSLTPVLAQLFGQWDFGAISPFSLGLVTGPMERTAGGGGADGDVLVNVENLFGTRFNDFLIGSRDANLLRGLEGDDALYGHSGDDVLEGGVDADRMNDGAGEDFAAYSTAGAGVVADLILTANNTGDAAGDSYANIQNLRGSMHSDILWGTFAANRIEGLDGDDVLRGRGGGDTYVGGVGDDTFIFQNNFGAETVLDFDALNANEKIDLSAVGAITDFTDLFNNHLSISAAGSVITVGTGTITLAGVAAGNLDAGDFVF